MEEQIRFDNRFGESLAGTLHRPAGRTDRGIVLGHCFTCSRHTGILRQLSEDLARAGFAALRFDFSGNGQSHGVFMESTYSKQVSEMQTAAGLLEAEGVNWIGLAGHSLGAAVSILTASASPEVRAVCALAGRLSGLSPRHFLGPEQQQELDRTGKVRFQSRGRSLQLTDVFFSDAGRYDLAGALAAVKAPVLVVHGDADEIIPVSEAHRAEKIAPGKVTLEIVPGADHMFSNREQRVRLSERIVEWFRRIYG